MYFENTDQLPCNVICLTIFVMSFILDECGDKMASREFYCKWKRLIGVGVSHYLTFPNPDILWNLGWTQKMPMSEWLMQAAFLVMRSEVMAGRPSRLASIASMATWPDSGNKPCNYFNCLTKIGLDTWFQLGMMSYFSFLLYARQPKIRKRLFCLKTAWEKICLAYDKRVLIGSVFHDG